MFTRPTTHPPIALELAPIPQTACELWDYSEAWLDEMNYLANIDSEKYVKEYAYAKYQADLFSWLAIHLRKKPQYTSEHRFDIELIQESKNLFDRSFPDKVKPEHLRRNSMEKLEKTLTDFDFKVPDAIQNLKDAISNAINELADGNK